MTTTGESLARSAPFLLDYACLKTKRVKIRAGIALFKMPGWPGSALMSPSSGKLITGPNVRDTINDDLGLGRVNVSPF